MAKLSKKETRVLKCPKCSTEFEVTATPRQFERGKAKRFCSRKCANSREWSEGDKLLKQKRAYDVHGVPEEDRVYNTEPTRPCKWCGTTLNTTGNNKNRMFCNNSCAGKWRYHTKGQKIPLTHEIRVKLQESGRRSAAKQAETRRSKNEKHFFKLCSTHFNEVRANDPMFNGWDADVVIDDCKIAVLWNGRWHYQKITKKHSVKQVQNRDRIKRKEIRSAGYVPYVIKDLGREDEEFVVEQFEKFVSRIPQLTVRN